MGRRAAGSLVALVAATPFTMTPAAALGTAIGRSAGPGSTPAAAAAGPPCLVPHGGGPGFNATIGNADNAKTVCLSVGQKLLVVLSAGVDSTVPWGRIHVAPTGVLRPAALTLMFSRGVTGENFQAVRTGTVRLSAERRPCALAPSGAHCDVIELWQATVVVRAAHPAGGTAGAGPLEN